MRIFLALNVPEETRQALHEAAAPLREAAPEGVSWTAAEKIHLTLKFLGEQPDDMPARLVAALRGPLARARPVDLDLRGVGAFPAMKRPRVVWVGVRPEPRLELLHHDVEVACEGVGFEVEGRPFRPHLTLGRVRPGAPPDLPRRLAAAAREVHLRGDARVETVDVMRSEPAAGGSRYTVLERVPLGT
ncbi:MAG: RNA 2',3'-cyclic phosphodiesterase [Gemmatimonadaceae bacterium]